MHRFTLRDLRALATCLLCTVETTHLEAARPFTVADDVGISKFETRSLGVPGNHDVLLSPNGTMLAVITERGLLDRNRVEDSVWIWNINDVQEFLAHPEQALPPPPRLLVQMGTFERGPIISDLRWQDDSSGVAFLAVSRSGRTRVFEKKLVGGTARGLTPTDQDVVGFDLRAGTLAYTVASPERLSRSQSPRSRPSFVAGKSLVDSLFPLDRYPERARDAFNLCDLWAVLGGRRFRVENLATHEPAHVYQWPSSDPPHEVFSVSPDGRSLALVNAVETVPEAWGEYKAKPDTAAPSFLPGKQDLRALDDGRLVAAYFVLDLITGLSRQLLDAPEGSYKNWWGESRVPRWSPSGLALLLPNAFLPLGGVTATERGERLLRPCVTVLELRTHKSTCLKPREALEDFSDAEFAPSDNAEVFLRGHKSSVRMRESPSGSWQTAAGEGEVGTHLAASGLQVEVHQDLNQRPVLEAKNAKTNRARLLWDPNPQLDAINLGEVSVLRWVDTSGHAWEAGLVKPPDFEAGRRYPLVIQTHGFWKGTFVTHGAAQTAFAARELAAREIVVLQMPDDLQGVVSTPQEAPRHVAGFEGAVEQLAAQGVIDPLKVGLVGFSRTCYYVMQALTTSKVHFAAASITDGVTYGYWQHVGFATNGAPLDDDAVIGASAVGSGLKTWLARSPEFNLDRVDTPLLIVEQGGFGILEQWEEYEGLRSQNKPVEMLDLGGENYEHVLTNPRKRLASLGSTVDWMRFWLQGYEDPEQSKSEQYRRWEKLCDMQRRTIPEKPTFCVGFK